MLYGAIIGDMVGVPFEFLSTSDPNFEFFSAYSRFSDDTVLTIAVADALMRCKNKKEEDASDIITDRLVYWGKKYPHAGYGTGFAGWLSSSQHLPYNSYGNGSAMRVSAAGWIYDTMEETEQKAAWTANVSHSHPEGIKGAQATAACIFLGRNKATKEEIRDYIEQKYGYDLHRSWTEIVNSEYVWNATCQGSVPEAIISFLDSENYEDAVRKAILLKGDADTMACIAGAIAEAFYGELSDNFKNECRKRLPSDMLEVVDRFEDYVVNGKNSKKWYSFLPWT